MRVDKAKMRMDTTKKDQDVKNKKPSRGGVYTEDFVGEYYNISVDKLIPFKNQARKFFDQESILGLAVTIKDHGIRQPLTVVPSEIKPGYFEVVSGERRLRAAKSIEMLNVPCIIIHDIAKAEEVAIIENIQRKDLHPIELGSAYENLLEMKICSSASHIAEKLGVHKSSVIDAISFANLDDTTKARLMDKQIKNRDFLRALVKAEESDRGRIIEEYICTAKTPCLPKDKKRSIKTKSQILNIIFDGKNLIINKNRTNDLDDEMKEKFKELMSHLLDG